MTLPGRRESLRVLAALTLAAALVAAAGAARAHHGWAWTTGGNIELTGVIVEARLGNPHGILIVDVDGERWTVEVGQPWRNERAGLNDGDLAPGVEIRAVGEPAADIADKRLKVERLYLGEREYDLYPRRD
ncbi:MAG: DUF6152 family protein [Alphaproteobacteria bacterium]|nr:DUF6152 family protein [Alphaproteobacteria bacterium]